MEQRGAWRWVASGLVATLVLAMLVMAVVDRSTVGASITAPTRVYGPSTTPGTPLFFTGMDPISGQDRAITVVAPEGDCAPTYDNDWDPSGCSSVTLTMQNTGAGKLDIPGAVFTDDPNPLKDVVRDGPAGSIITQSLDGEGGPSWIYRFIGTEAQLNATLATLLFQPDDGYEHTGTDVRMLVEAVPGDNSGNAESQLVEIKIEGINEFPSLGVPSGPIPVTAGVDTFVPENMGDPAEFTVSDGDVDQGESDDVMLLAMVTSCGEFWLQGGTFQIGDDIETLLSNPPLSLDPLVVAAIMDVIPEELKTAVFGTDNPSDPQVAFAAVGDLSEVQYALERVGFSSATDDQTCVLTTFVTDLGNNGMPVSYEGDPPTGVEVPVPGWGLGFTVFQVGEGTPLTVTIDQALAQPDPTDVSPIVFDVVFSEAVSDFDAGDIDFTLSTAGGSLAATINGSGATYTVEVTGMTDPGEVIVSIPAGVVSSDVVSTITNEGSTSTDNSVTWDPDLNATTTTTSTPEETTTTTTPETTTTAPDGTTTTAPGDTTTTSTPETTTTAPDGTTTTSEPDGSTTTVPDATTTTVAATTTTAAATTTTAAATTTTAGPTTTVGATTTTAGPTTTVAGPTTTAGVTTTTIDDGSGVPGGGTTTTAAPTTTRPPTTTLPGSGAGGLPETGTRSTPLAAFALIVAGLGLAAVTVARRRHV